MAEADVATRPIVRDGAGRSVVDGVFAVLEVIAHSADGIGLTAVASASGLPKATTYRLLEQLSRHGAVERWDGRYYVGGRLFRLGQSRRGQHRLWSAALRPVTDLVELTGATAIVAVDGDHGVLAVHTELGEVDELVAVRPGACFSMRTAAGTALRLAHPGPALTGPVARECLARFRHTGTVIERDGVVTGVSCVAAPVFVLGRVVSGVVTAMVRSGRPLEPIAAAVRSSARAISEGLRTS